MIRLQPRHRWQTASRDSIRGFGTGLFTLCSKRRLPVFTDAELVAKCLLFLQEALGSNYCRADAYCFMPDHLHALVTGVNESADAWHAMVVFKRATGYWFWKSGYSVRWQDGFDVRLLEPDYSKEAAAAYVFNNPVVAGLARAWDEYPYSGSIPWYQWPGERPK
jgi:REP element-mobilizing transposase RayT